MNTFIPLEKLADTDLHDFHEVWMTSDETYPHDPSHAQSVCLWRVDRVLTRDVSIDDDYFQDLPCLWVRVDELENRQAIGQVEQALRSALEEQNLSGQFYPKEMPDTQEGSDARDLRS